MKRAIVRGYINGCLQFEETLDYCPENLESMRDIAQSHVERVIGPWPSMLEIEWPDGTYTRFGSDTRGMVAPVPIIPREEN